MPFLKLTTGEGVLVDEGDFEYLNQWKWHSESGRYAVRKEYYGKAPNGKHLTRWIRMHRLITDAPDKMEVDHINGNGLDNRRSNLRICTHKQNSHNTRKRKDNRSGYKGVGWHTQHNKWRARIVVDGRQKHLGLFDTPEQAAIAYNTAAEQFFGEFAHITKRGG